MPSPPPLSSTPFPLTPRRVPPFVPLARFPIGRRPPTVCQRQKRPLSHPDGGVTVTSLSRTSRAYGSPRLSPGDNRESLSSRYSAPMKRSFHGVAFTNDDYVVVIVVSDAPDALRVVLPSRFILLLSCAFLSLLSMRTPFCFSSAMLQKKLLITPPWNS